MSLSTALDSVARLINFKRRREAIAAGDLATIDADTASGPPSVRGRDPSTVIAHVPPPPAEPSRVVSLAPLTEKQ